MNNNGNGIGFSVSFALAAVLPMLPTTFGETRSEDIGVAINGLDWLNRAHEQSYPLMTFEKPRRVLLVEDDPIVAMMVEDIFRDMGLEVLVDHTLVNAICDIESTTFDVALIDVGLRGENARPVMAALLAKHTPFAVMSGGDLSSLAIEFPQVPMHSKPLGMNALQKIVRKLLQATATEQ